MYRTKVPQRLLWSFVRSVAAVASLALASTVPAFADQLVEQHNHLVTKFVHDMHADPLVADCAAHGYFVAGTSSAIDHVEFLTNSFDNAHAAVIPWNDSFGERKQHIKVDSVVTVDGLGIRSNGGAPLELKFRCGYVGGRLFAFSWNDPAPTARDHHKGAFGKRRLVAAL
jgi:hypothetical protein